MNYTTVQQDEIIAEFEDSQAIKQQLLEMWLAYTGNAIEALGRWQTLLYSWKNIDIPDDVFMAGLGELLDANLIEWADSCPVNDPALDYLRRAVSDWKGESDEPS